jgi:chromosome segregation ATPase
MTMSNRQEKQQKLMELRDAIARLETELERDQELDLHQAIDQLDQHFEVVETKFNNLKVSWSTLKSDWGNDKS